MSPMSDQPLRSRTSFPRVSGDEPGCAEGFHEESKFSPRERG